MMACEPELQVMMKALLQSAGWASALPD